MSCSIGFGRRLVSFQGASYPGFINAEPNARSSEGTAVSDGDLFVVRLASQLAPDLVAVAVHVPRGHLG